MIDAGLADEGEKHVKAVRGKRNVGRRWRRRGRS
jgi:hypothetical protein